MDEDLATFDYYKGTDEFDERNRTQECEECVPELCPLLLGCRAGLVQDSCGCCSQCANLEGQTCDLGQRTVYYGLCGENLECKLDRSDGADGEEPETQCVCLSQKPLCGTDGQTYMNICKYKEAAYSNPGLNVSDGPCRTVPIIKVPPHNLVNVTGSSIAFLCEVFAFPMALSRGGPQKYELSSWLQIEEASQMDSGTYRCIARNELGHVSATAILGVLPPDEMSTYLEQNVNEMMSYEQLQDYDRDYY
ncbi:Kazal-type serine protease inhibitor domain-containing protein 1 [Labeo rohita]|uniref:Kazal-type serine protease inhibitor domain-containing protein 1 n=1 Tax=Labeo rohita TaxID=84645 RepID=A0ABQ8MH19_LABRO|nr:Kazal-type serine protease inhibitor domain-containing protein 1 [Labeo rohita]